MSKTFFFYDLETSGLSARDDRIMQFAGQRTDSDLNPVGEPINIMVKSTPRTLTPVKSTSDGGIVASITIPAELPIGYHTLHLTGTLKSGEKIDYYDSFLLVSSHEDSDGDGMANASDKCQFVDPINQDIDQDGLDDACDGFVGAQPVVTTPVESKDEAISNSGTSGHNGSVLGTVVQALPLQPIMSSVLGIAASAITYQDDEAVAEIPDALSGKVASQQEELTPVIDIPIFTGNTNSSWMPMTAIGMIVLLFGFLLMRFHRK